MLSKEEIDRMVDRLAKDILTLKGDNIEKRASAICWVYLNIAINQSRPVRRARPEVSLNV